MNYDDLTRPVKPLNRLFAWLLLVLLVLSFAIFLIVGPKIFLHSADNLLSAPVARIAPQVVSLPDPNEAAIERRATELTRLLQRHWEDSLLAVEQVNIKNVTILEFHPDYANKKLFLRGEAKEFFGLDEYIKQLNATGLVSHVALMHEQGVSREHIDTIEFELTGDL